MDSLSTTACWADGAEVAKDINSYARVQRAGTAQANTTKSTIVKIVLMWKVKY
jgi:hypothetical protein